MIAMIGSGEYLPEMEPVDRFLVDGLAEPARVVCLPTAAGKEGAERIGYWSVLGVEHFTRMGIEVRALPVVARQDAQNPDLAAQVRAANFVYLSGGSPDYLLDILQGSLVWEAIEQVLAGGGLLAGCSAGAIVQGEKIPGFPFWRKAFNLLPGSVVVPHFDEFSPRLVRLVRLWMGRRRTMIGVPGFTALVKNGSACRVVGKSSVTVWDKDGRRTYAPGEAVPGIAA
jgi:cyanophycinase